MEGRAVSNSLDFALPLNYVPAQFFLAKAETFLLLLGDIKESQIRKMMEGTPPSNKAEHIFKGSLSKVSFTHVQGKEELCQNYNLVVFKAPSPFPKRILIALDFLSVFAGTARTHS